MKCKSTMASRSGSSTSSLLAGAPGPYSLFLYTSKPLGSCILAVPFERLTARRTRFPAAARLRIRGVARTLHSRGIWYAGCRAWMCSPHQRKQPPHSVHAVSSSLAKQNQTSIIASLSTDNNRNMLIADPCKRVSCRGPSRSTRTHKDGLIQRKTKTQVKRKN